MFANKHAASILFGRNTLRQSKAIARVIHLQHMPLTGIASMTSMRGFATDSISSGASKLNRALEKEIKYENENYT